MRSFLLEPTGLTDKSRVTPNFEDSSGLAGKVCIPYYQALTKSLHHIVKVSCAFLGTCAQRDTECK